MNNMDYTPINYLSFLRWDQQFMVEYISKNKKNHVDQILIINKTYMILPTQAQKDYLCM